jgi:hypothetical protein
MSENLSKYELPTVPSSIIKNLKKVITSGYDFGGISKKEFGISLNCAASSISSISTELPSAEYFPPEAKLYTHNNANIRKQIHKAG